MEVYKDDKGNLICGRKTREGKQCSKPPGLGTPLLNKPGMPCYKHGGRDPKMISKAAEMPSNRKDLTFQFVDEALKKRADEFARDPDLMDLRREVGLCRARLEKLKGEDDTGTSMITASLSQTIGKLIDRIHRMEMERSGLVQMGLVRLLIDSWQKAIMEVIPDINLRNVLSRRMLDLSRSKLALVIEVPPSRQLVGSKQKGNNEDIEVVQESDKD